LVAALLATGGLAALPLPAVAVAEQEGEPPIAFVSDRAGSLDVWVGDEMGNKQRRLTRSPAADADPAWSPDGRRIAFASNRTGFWQLYVINADGTGERPLTATKATDSSPVWSPDGNSIAFETNRDGNWEIYVMAADGSAQRNVSNDPRDDFRPSWAPDARRLVYQRVAGRRSELVVTDVRKPDPQTLPTPGPAFDAAWSPDGAEIAFTGFVRQNYDIYVLDLDSRGLRRLTRSPAEDAEPSWSPDGRFLAFVSVRTGNYEVFTTDRLGKRQVNLTRAARSVEIGPAWAPRGALPPAVVVRTLESGTPTGGFACTTPGAGSGPGLINGTANADTLCGTANAETIKGLAANDTLIGNPSTDNLQGWGGADTSYARDCTKDTLYGGTPSGDGNNGDAARVDWTKDVRNGIDKYI
jgi:Tol biopolymer transport system component